MPRPGTKKRMWFEKLDEAIICVCYWYMGAGLSENWKQLSHYAEQFNCHEWNDVKEVWKRYAYRNPFHWRTTKEHFYSKR